MALRCGHSTSWRHPDSRATVGASVGVLKRSTMADEQQLAFSARVSKPGTSGDTETPTSNPTCPGPYLYEADLSRANLSGAKLIDADLRFRAPLQGRSQRGGPLRGNFQRGEPQLG